MPTDFALQILPPALSRESLDVRAPGEPAARRGLKLHIGGQQRRDGWTVLDVQPGPAVDIVADCMDLRGLADGAAAEIYASHVLEHLGYADVPRALAEWLRVLEPGGQVRISVPDLAKLGPTLAHPKLPPEVRAWVIATIYGGQTDTHDFHRMGFTLETLSDFLRKAGFDRIARVAEFGLFDDSSKLKLGPTLISLNVSARKPGEIRR
jgi:predicted SAM-dependent methyltransferase